MWANESFIFQSTTQRKHLFSILCNALMGNVSTVVPNKKIKYTSNFEHDLWQRDLTCSFFKDKSYYELLKNKQLQYDKIFWSTFCTIIGIAVKCSSTPQNNKKVNKWSEILYLQTVVTALYWSTSSLFVVSVVSTCNPI